MKKLAMLLSVMMLVAFTSGISVAKTKAAKVRTATGVVVQVNDQAGTVVIKIHNKDQTLKAEPKMLEGLAAGAKVTIQSSGDMLKSIKPVAGPTTMAAPKK